MLDEPTRQVESETNDGEDTATTPPVPVQEGQPSQPKARRRRRTQKPTIQAERLNPLCSNPACIVTCSPNCENLHDVIEWTAEQQAERLARNDPTLRSMDVMP